ncbi:MAG: fibronectin type III domain-containing protein [Acidiferrobacterales bacterium]
MGRSKLLPIALLGTWLLTGCGGGGNETTDQTMSLTASGISPTEIALSWTPARVGADVYPVYMNGNFLVAVPGASFVVTGLTPETTYCFQVITEDACSTILCIIETSNEACATTLP